MPNKSSELRRCSDYRKSNYSPIVELLLLLFFWRREGGEGERLVNDDVTLEGDHQMITLDYGGEGESKIRQKLIT